MDLGDGPNWPRLHEILPASYLLLPFRHYSIFFLVCRSFFVYIVTGFGFLFASDLFACILSFCLQQTIFYRIDPCGPPHGTSSFSSDHCELISVPVVFTQIVTENEF